MRGFTGQMLVAIAEAILHNTCKYFIDHHKEALAAMADNKLVYSALMTKYMDDKIKRAWMHRARQMGTVEHRFEILCMDKGCRGGNSEWSVQECILRNGSCSCSCMKPKLLHKSCSHAIAACSLIVLVPRQYVS